MFYLKKIISLLLLCILLTGCSSEQSETSVSSDNVPVTTTASAPVTTKKEKPKLSVEGLEIEYDGEDIYVYIPADYTDENIGEYFRETEGIIYVPDEDSMFCAENRALYSKDMTKLYAVPAECEDIIPGGSVEPVQKCFTVPESVTWISPNAFYIITTSRPLINIYLPDSITEENRKELVLWGGTYVHRIEDMK